jgi:hypothetical protein
MSHKQHERHRLATAPDGPTNRVSQTPDGRARTAVGCPLRGEAAKAALGAAWGSAFGFCATVFLPCERVFDFAVSQPQDDALPDSRKRRGCRVAVPRAVQLHDGCRRGRRLRGAFDVRKLKRDAKARAPSAEVDLSKTSAPAVYGKPSVMPTPTARVGLQCRGPSDSLCRTDERPRRSDYGEDENPATHGIEYRLCVRGRASSTRHGEPRIEILACARVLSPGALRDSCD